MPTNQTLQAPLCKTINTFSCGDFGLPTVGKLCGTPAIDTAQCCVDCSNQYIAVGGCKVAKTCMQSGNTGRVASEVFFNKCKYPTLRYHTDYETECTAYHGCVAMAVSMCRAAIAAGKACKLVYTTLLGTLIGQAGGGTMSALACFVSSTLRQTPETPGCPQSPAACTFDAADTDPDLPGIPIPRS